MPQTRHIFLRSLPRWVYSPAVPQILIEQPSVHPNSTMGGLSVSSNTVTVLSLLKFNVDFSLSTIGFPLRLRFWAF